MFSAFEWTVAMRYLRPRRKEGFISVIALFSFLGIFLGVATLIIVMSVMNGFRQELLGRILGLNGHVSVYGGVEGLTDYDRLRDLVAAMPGVVLVDPMIENQVMATANGVARGAMVRGLRPEDMRQRGIVTSHIVDGALDDFAGDDAVVAGDLPAFDVVRGSDLHVRSRGVMVFGAPLTAWVGKQGHRSCERD